MKEWMNVCLQNAKLNKWDLRLLYLTPNAGNTYQTLANPEAHDQQENYGDKIMDYSHLERDLKTNPPAGYDYVSSNTSNQYEKLNLH